MASRLYSAGEHISAGICDTLGISESDLDPDKREKRVSRQSKLAKYVSRHLPEDHPLAGAGKVLAGYPEWFLIAGYRSKSVHSQPPTLAGLGITYQRDRQRWTTTFRQDGSVAGHQISVGGGDPPIADIDDLLAKATTALRAFVDYAAAVVEFYFSQLSHHGIKYDPAAGTTTIGRG